MYFFIWQIYFMKLKAFEKLKIVKYMFQEIQIMCMLNYSYFHSHIWHSSFVFVALGIVEFFLLIHRQIVGRKIICNWNFRIECSGMLWWFFGFITYFFFVVVIFGVSFCYFTVQVRVMKLKENTCLKNKDVTSVSVLKCSAKYFEMYFAILCQEYL